MLKNRVEHVDKYMVLQMVSAYNAMVMDKGRRNHMVFNDKVSAVLHQKQTADAVEAAMKASFEASRRNAGLFSLFG